MGTRLNARIKGATSVEHELFATEERAFETLRDTLELHKKKGRTVFEQWDGQNVRYQVIDKDGGLVAEHWLSETEENPSPAM